MEPLHAGQDTNACFVRKRSRVNEVKNDVDLVATVESRLSEDYSGRETDREIKRFGFRSAPGGLIFRLLVGADF